MLWKNTLLPDSPKRHCWLGLDCIVWAKYFSVNQGKYFTVNQGKYFTANQGKYFTVNQGKYFTVNQGKYFTANQAKYFTVNQGGHNCGWKLGAGTSSVQIYFRKVSNKVSLCSLQYYSLLKAKCQTKSKHAVLPRCQAYWDSGKSKEIMPVYDYNDNG